MQSTFEMTGEAVRSFFDDSENARLATIDADAMLPMAEPGSALTEVACDEGRWNGVCESEPLPADGGTVMYPGSLLPFELPWPP